jgi:hypothetical protein
LEKGDAEVAATGMGRRIFALSTRYITTAVARKNMEAGAMARTNAEEPTTMCIVAACSKTLGEGYEHTYLPIDSDTLYYLFLSTNHSTINVNKNNN